MARFNVRGNEMMDDYARDLDIPFKRNGAMVVCIHESEKDGLKDLYDRAKALLDDICARTEAFFAKIDAQCRPVCNQIEG